MWKDLVIFNVKYDVYESSPKIALVADKFLFVSPPGKHIPENLFPRIKQVNITLFYLSNILLIMAHIFSWHVSLGHLGSIVFLISLRELYKGLKIDYIFNYSKKYNLKYKEYCENQIKKNIVIQPNKFLMQNFFNAVNISYINIIIFKLLCILPLLYFSFNSITHDITLVEGIPILEFVPHQTVFFIPAILFEIRVIIRLIHNKIITENLRKKYPDIFNYDISKDGNEINVKEQTLKKIKFIEKSQKKYPNIFIYSSSNDDEKIDSIVDTLQKIELIEDFKKEYSNLLDYNLDIYAHSNIELKHTVKIVKKIFTSEYISWDDESKQLYKAYPLNKKSTADITIQKTKKTYTQKLEFNFSIIPTVLMLWLVISLNFPNSLLYTFIVSFSSIFGSFSAIAALIIVLSMFVSLCYMEKLNINKRTKKVKEEISKTSILIPEDEEKLYLKYIKNRYILQTIVNIFIGVIYILLAIYFYDLIVSLSPIDLHLLSVPFLLIFLHVIQGAHESKNISNLYFSLRNFGYYNNP